VAEPGLRLLAARERQRELRIAATGGERQREAAAEASVDVRDQVAAICLPKALDVCGADEQQLLGHAARERHQRLVANRHPLDRLASFRLDHRARDRIQAASRQVAEDVYGELLAAELRLDDR